MGTQTPSEILEEVYRRAVESSNESFVVDEETRERIDYVSRCVSNRSGVRSLLACALAKAHDPSVDVRRPYTDLGQNSYSGRTYDEQYVTPFINRYELPCTITTAFLTPAFRAKNVALEPGVKLGGRPARLYENIILLLNDVEEDHLNAEILLTETVRNLILLKQERQQRVLSLLSELETAGDEIPLSSEDIVKLVQQHLSLPKASRLPVLVVAAAYQAASQQLGERVLPLQSHTAADERTGALGDVEITLASDDHIVTSYEMKMKRVTIDDIDRALWKVTNASTRIDNYIFITTDLIDDDVTEYAKSLYAKTGGIEFAILDCIGFLRHFLHLFHRLRIEFLEIYQDLVLNEPDNVVRQPLKEALLTLRQVAESSYAVEDEV